MLRADIHQLVIVVTAAKFGARYEMYGHEYFAQRAGLSDDKIATIAAVRSDVGLQTLTA